MAASNCKQKLKPEKSATLPGNERGLRKPGDSQNRQLSTYIHKHHRFSRGQQLRSVLRRSTNIKLASKESSQTHSLYLPMPSTKTGKRVKKTVFHNLFPTFLNTCVNTELSHDTSVPQPGAAPTRKDPAVRARRAQGQAGDKPNHPA